MLPKTVWAANHQNLHVFNGPEHPFQDKNLRVLDLKSNNRQHLNYGNSKCSRPS